MSQYVVFEIVTYAMIECVFESDYNDFFLFFFLLNDLVYLHRVSIFNFI